MLNFIKKYKDLLSRDMRWHLIREKTIKNYLVNFYEDELKFYCSSLKELYRARTALTKEPGTVKWIVEDFREGEVFYDIGANIGVYSLMAAKLVKENGQVYSFEPHAINFASLLRNISLNHLQNTICPLSYPLHDKTEFIDFNYKTLITGSSNSQLGTKLNSEGNKFEPEIAQKVCAYDIDYLISDHIIKSPDHIKIDVDGNEINIIKGMKKLLESKRLKTIQVEINIPIRNEVVAFMNNYGYQIRTRHYTAGGQRRIDMGHDPESYPYNVVFSL